MTSSPELIPTLIVDKNGKQTTVRKKPQAASTGKALPAPNIAAAEQRARKRLVKDILAILEADHRLTNRSEWSEEGKQISKHLAKEKDHEYLQKVHDVCALMTKESQIGDLWQLSRVLCQNGKDALNAMHAHLDWISANPGYTTRFVTLQHALVVNRRVKPESNGTIPHIETHLHAQARYNAARNKRTDYALVQQYEFNYPYMEMVEKHADHIDALFDYRDARALEGTTIGVDDMDEQDFAEYLKHNAVKDGWL